MYSRTAGVKASLLPPAVETRSQSKMKAVPASSESAMGSHWSSIVPDAPSKKQRTSSSETTSQFPASSDAVTSSLSAQSAGLVASLSARFKGPAAASTSSASGRTVTPNVFLADLEQHPGVTGPPVCEVTDESIQDPWLRDIYKGLPPLFARHVHPSYVRNGNFEDREIQSGGHVLFSAWDNSLGRPFSLVTLSTAMDFTQSGSFVNPVRISPTIVSIVAVCVTAGACVWSYIVECDYTNGSDPLAYKHIDVLLHSQDWERWEAFMCMCFWEAFMYTSMSDRAMQFSTVKVKASAVKPEREEESDLPLGLLSPSKKKPATASSSLRPAYKSYSLTPNDTVPVYDARFTDFNFSTGLPTLDETLPLWTKGQIPCGSFVVVGYSPSSFSSKKETRNMLKSFLLLYAPVARYKFRVSHPFGQPTCSDMSSGLGYIIKWPVLNVVQDAYGQSTFRKRA
ncbi:hypothetical protein B0H14DRAFT_3432358 [Mycena olivaceomarginata]|nr:hypothetical protein B0H14DRAFT_3432358 [Mycena olivaceomarginata]